MAFNVGAIVSEMILKLNSWDQSIAKIKNDQKKFREGNAKTNKGLKSLGDQISKIGKKLTVVSAAFAAIGAAGTLAANKLNKGMAGVATLLNEPIGQIGNLKESVQDMSIDFGKNTEDMTKGLFQVISAFGEGSDKLRILNIASRAATAGMSTTKEAIDLATIVTKSYGDQSAEAIEKTLDLAFVTNKLGVTTFPELAQSMGRVVPLAAQLGVKQEELFAGFAALTGVTGNTTEVSTQLSAIFRAMVKPTEDMQAALKKLEFATVEDMIATLGFQGAMKALRGETDGTTAGFARLFGRAEAIGAGLAITGSQAKKLEMALKANKEQVASSIKAYKNFSEGIGKTAFLFDQAKSTVMVMAQLLGDALAPALTVVMAVMKPFADVTMALMKGFNALPGPFKVVVGLIGGLLIAIPPLMVAWGGLLTLIATTPPAIMATTVAIGKMLGVLGLAVVAASALSFGFKKLGESYDRASAKIITDAERQHKAMKSLLEFRKTASKETLQMLKDVKEENRKAGKDYGEVAEVQIFMLRQINKEFQDWEKGVTEASDNATGNVVERTFERVDSYEKETEALENELDAQVEAEFEKAEIDKLMREQEAEDILMSDQMLNEDRDEMNQIWIDKFRALRKDKIKLTKTGLEKEQALERIAFEETKARLNAEVEDRTSKKLLLAEAEKIHLLKMKQIKDNHAKEDTARRKQSFGEWMSLASSAVGNLTNLYSTFQDKKIADLDKELEIRKAWIMENVTDESERAEQIKALEDEIATKKQDAAKKAAIADRLAAITGIIANTALGVSKALSMLNIPLAIVIGAMGAVQLGTAIAAPIPELAKGGITQGPQLAMVGDNPSGKELIIPLERAAEFGLGGDGEGGAGKSITVNINALDPSTMADIFNDQIIPLIQNSTKTENLIIYQNAIQEP